jgi:hypothetical protein
MRTDELLTDLRCCLTYMAGEVTPPRNNRRQRVGCFVKGSLG